MISREQSPSLTRFLAEVRKRSLLEVEHELHLVRRLRDGHSEARNALIESNMAFVVRVAKRYRNRGVPFEDLLNEGNLGLIEAAGRYEENKGARFLTFASWWIQKRILLALERGHLVHIPYSQQQRVREIRNTERQLATRLGRNPDRSEVSAHLDRSQRNVDASMQISTWSISLDGDDSDEAGSPISERLADERSISPEQAMIRRDTTRYISTILDSLSPPQRNVLIQRFGIDGNPPRILAEVAQQMGISRERVRQIEVQAMGRLRRIMARRSKPRRERAVSAAPRIA